MIGMINALKHQMSNITTADGSTAAGTSNAGQKGMHCLILGCGGIAMGIALSLITKTDENRIEKLVFIARDDAKGQQVVSDLISIVKKSKEIENNKNNENEKQNKPNMKINSNSDTIRPGDISKEIDIIKQKIDYIVADLSLIKSSLEGVNKYIKQYNSCDILISAAGEGPQTGVNSITIEKENRIFASNLLGHVIFTYYLLPLLNKSSFHGKVIYTVGEQKNYKDIPDIKNLKFDTIQRAQSSAAVSAVSNTDGSSTEDLQRTPTKTNSMNKKKSDTKRKSQTKQQQRSESKQQQPQSQIQVPSPYSAAKVGMFCIAMEIARKNPELNVALINPGIVRTNFHKDCGDNIPDEFFTATPEDVGALVDFIISTPTLFFDDKNKNGTNQKNAAKLFKVKVKEEIAINESASIMRFGDHVLDEKAQAEICDAILQHLNLTGKDAILDGNVSTLSSPSARSIKSGSSGSSSRGKSIIASKCGIM